MQKKGTILILATVPSMIGLFNMENIHLLQELGYKVEVGCNFKDLSVWDEENIKRLLQELKEKQVKCHQIPFTRSAHDIISHFKAYKQLGILLKKNNYKFVHCHTPIAGALGRAAAHNKKCRVIYTAHGFHFYRGAPILNWLLYYPIEKFFSRWTDVLITINQEDYKRAKRKFYAKEVRHIPGAGVKTEDFLPDPVGREDKRKELGIGFDDFLILSVGELNKNKNHKAMIEAISRLHDPKVKYAICGKGKLECRIQKLISKRKMEGQVFLLGYRSDVKELLWASDAFAFPSKREGLGLAAIEAMAAGAPLLTSNVHGINDYSIEGVNALKNLPTDIDGFKKSIKRLKRNPELRSKMGRESQRICKYFDIKVSAKKMLQIYKEQ